jgi:hypothetical protein
MSNPPKPLRVISEIDNPLTLLLDKPLPGTLTAPPDVIPLAYINRVPADNVAADMLQRGNSSDPAVLPPPSVLDEDIGVGI